MENGSKDIGMADCKDRIGMALRNDFQENVGVQSGETEYEQARELQERFSNELRVQIDQGLPVIPAPYLRTKTCNKEFTLVLDLDETLLHFEEIDENEGQLSIRPLADQFLKNMSEYFELVIFTAGTEEYADWALGYLESVDYISHRLYRQHALPFEGYYVKDLSRIGRDLKKMIIVDNIAQNF